VTSQFLDWKAGDRVVCVDDQWRDAGKWVECPLQAGRIYTIDGIGPGGGYYKGVFGTLAVSVKEVENPYTGSFAAARFRKVVTRPTSIAIFEALLNPSEPEIFRELEAEEFDYQDCTSILGARA
jgi:hypothetical protein